MGESNGRATWLKMFKVSFMGDSKTHGEKMIQQVIVTAYDMNEL